MLTMSAAQRKCVWALSATALVALTVYFSSPRSPSELMELDGIELAPNAVSKLSEGSASQPTYVHLSHESGKRINKLLKKDEKGEIDGIALDSRAEAELGNSAPASSRSNSHHASHRKARVSRAQTLLDEGKEDLDSSNWQDAVKLFSKAEAIWKRQGNEDFHWAASLKNDVLRAHPELAAQKASSHELSEHQKEVKDAEKQLASGHAFRSLYALLRERQAAKLGSRSPAVAPRRISTSSALSQASPPGKSSGVAKRIDAATKSAIQMLETQNKAMLKREEKAILLKAEEEKRKALARQHLRLAAASKEPALATWQSRAGPPAGTALRFATSGGAGREQALAEVPPSMRPPPQQLHYRQPNPSQYHTAAPYRFPEQYVPQRQYSQAGAVQQSLAGGAGVQGPGERQAVPVINLNLPAGQVVPAGQYEMEGRLDEDPAGHWDFVGDLLPRGGQLLAH